MSLMKTLAKVAIGVAVAKGASHMMKRPSTGQAGLGGLLGGLTNAPTGASGGLEDMLGGLMGGASGGGAGGLGALLDGLSAPGGGAGATGGLQDLIGGLAGGAGAGGVLGGLAQGLMQGRNGSNASSFGAVLNSAFDATPEPAIDPTPDQEAAAALMLSAMIQAAKSDGQLDDAEQAKLMDKLGGDIDSQEAAFLRAQMAAPVDVDALVSETPRGMGPQIYAMSVLAIDLDSQAEAQYLHALAQGFGMDAGQVNDIHAQLGVPSLYT